MAQEILKIPPSVQGVVVEAGSYKGGSTAKLSLVARLAGRKLVVFDSFEGLPPNTEVYTNRHGSFYCNDKSYGKSESLSFLVKGQYKGTLKEVKHNIKLYGAPEVCMYRKGFFEETMKLFHGSIAAIFLDVDLSFSTKTCLKYLYPLLQTNGILYSHDGHFSRVLDVFKNRTFWKKKVGIARPTIIGMEERNLLKIVKRRPTSAQKIA